MVKNHSIIKKITLILLTSTMSVPFNMHAIDISGFFGNIFSSAKDALLSPIKRECDDITSGYQKAKTSAIIAACLLGGMAGYKAIIKPITHIALGKPGKVATKAIDTGIKWTIIGTVFCGIFYLYNKFVVERKILDAVAKAKEEVISKVDFVEKKVDTTREEVIKTNTNVTETKEQVKAAEANLNRRFDNTDSKLEELKQDADSKDLKLEAIKQVNTSILSEVTKGFSGKA